MYRPLTAPALRALSRGHHGAPLPTFSEALLTLARRVALAHRPLPGAVAAMVTGSVAKGLADEHSDIDMAVYYSGPLPDDPCLEHICVSLGGQNRRPLGPREEGGFVEAFDLGGVEVQLIHSTIAGQESTMDELLVQLAVDTPLAKALEGMLNCEPFYGEDYIQRWKARAADFPQALRLAMVNRYLRFFPAWGVQSQFTTRDASVWYHQMLAENVSHLVGVLSGLNSVYYTPFQFKRMARHVAQLTVAPERLGPRLEGLFHAPAERALPELERLVAETLTLVEAQLPEVDTAAARRRIGWTRPPLRLEAVLLVADPESAPL